MYLFLCSFILQFLAGRDCLTLFRDAKQRRCRSGAWHPASHFWGNKRSFVATKVQLAWKILQRRAMSSRVLFCAKITVERGFRTKCTTLFFKGTYHFDRGIESIRLPGVSDRIFLGLCAWCLSTVWNFGIWDEYWISFRRMVMSVHPSLNYRKHYPLALQQKGKEYIGFRFSGANELGYFSMMQ